MSSRTYILLAAVMVLAAFSACMRVDVAETHIHVPGLANETDYWVVTNAAHHELSGIAGTRRHWCEVDLASGTMHYHEGPELRDRNYLGHMVAELNRIGYEAQLVSLAHNPPPLSPLKNHPPVQDWGQRHTLVIKFPGMKTQRDTNRIVDALAVARAGGRDTRIEVSPNGRTISVHQFDKRGTAFKNFESAIATVGFQANELPPNLGIADPPRRGWVPLAS